MNLLFTFWNSEVQLTEVVLPLMAHNFDPASAENVMMLHNFPGIKSEFKSSIQEIFKATRFKFTLD